MILSTSLQEASGMDAWVDQLLSQEIGLPYPFKSETCLGADFKDVPQEIVQETFPIPEEPPLLIPIDLELMRLRPEAPRPEPLSLVVDTDEKRNEKELVLIAVRSVGRALRLAGAELRNDPEVVLTALCQDPSALQYASDELRDNRDFICMAVRHAKNALPFASIRLQQDPEVIAALSKGIVSFQIKKK